jgi:hypothetical protein
VWGSFIEYPGDGIFRGPKDDNGYESETTVSCGVVTSRVRGNLHPYIHQNYHVTGETKRLDKGTVLKVLHSIPHGPDGAFTRIFSVGIYDEA